MAILSLETLTQLLRHYFFVNKNQTAEHFDSDTDFFNSGLLDAHSAVEFVIYIEKLLNKEIALGDFTLTSIKSVASIYDHYVLG
jgi:hypothetical protein